MKRILSGLGGLAFLLLLGAPLANAQTITTVVGTGVAGSTGDGSPAAAATLNLPYRVATDAAGNLFIAERNGHRIRRVDAGTGDITTVAGTGTAGFSGDGGAATAAQLNSPNDVAVDPANGDLIIADTGNHRIRRVDVATGDITTVAGDGTPGNGGDTGPGVAAQLNTPFGVVVLANGDVLITDQNNNRIRCLLAVNSDIVAFAGTGVAGFSGDGAAGLLARMNQPRGITRNAAGEVFFTDTDNHRIRRISSGVITTVAGSGTAGFSGDGAAATAAQLNFPHGIAVHPDGTLLIADSTNNRVRLAVIGGNISTFAGTGTAGSAGDTGPALSAQLSVPISLAFDSNTNLFIADRDNHKIRRISAPPVGTPPNILAQPQPVAQITGSSVALTVTANGSPPLAYQWFFTNGPVPFATGPSLSFPAAQPTNSGDYFVVITNAFGSITSAPALLTITNSTAPPVLTLQPQSQSVIVSNTVAFTTTATGALPLNYQWFFNSNLLGGATSPTLTLPNVQASQAGTYFLVVTNNFGSITSAAATLLVITSPPPPFQWIVPGGSTNTDFAGGVAADAAGNSYFAGSFQGTMTMGGQSLASLGSFDAVFAKLDSKGNVVWLTQGGSGINSDRGLAVAVDTAGNVYGAGRFEGSYQLGVTRISGQGGDDCMAVKFNSNGVRQWIKGGGGGGDDQATALAVDGGGNLFLVGNLMGGPTFNTAQFDTTTVTNRSPINSSFNGFVAKYNPSGTLQWVFSYGGTTNNTTTTGAGVDAAGNAYVVGTFTGTIEFGTNTVSHMAGGTFTDGFLAKVTPSGAVAWVRNFPRLTPAGINVRADGTCYVTGRFGGTQTLGPDTLSAPANGEVFLAKFDPAGTPLWARQATTTGNSITAAGLAVDPQENVFITGHFNTGTTLGGTTLTNAGLQDIYVAKFDRNGSARWAKRAGGGQDDFAAGIAADGMGNAYLVGSHFTNANFDVLTLPATPDGDRSFFITKLASAGGPVPVPSGLVGWWAGEGFAVDYAWTNHGTFTNAATIVPNGQVGSAFSFDGTTSAVVTYPSTLKAAYTNLTLEAWVFPTNHSTGTIYGRTVIGHTDGDGFALRLNSGVIQADLRLTSGDVLFNAGPVLPLNTWSHIAYTYDGTRVIAYLNGLAQGSFAATGAVRNVANTNVPLVIGHEGSGATIVDVDQRFAWAGLLDEVAIFSRALAPTEIQSVFTAGSMGKARPAAPFLITQPQSQTVFQGTPVQFDITAVGYAPFSYQWRLNGTNVPGQTNAVLTLPGAYSAHEGTYDLRVTQFDGVNLLSTPATLNVLGQGEAKTLFGTTNDVNNFVRSAGGPSQWFLTSSNSIQVVPGTGNIQSTQSFGDFILHAEFLLPASGNGNCGIFLQGRYEVQIFNSFGVTVLGSNDCGAIWGQIPPSTNACRPAGQWQTYDIIFRQPQWNGNTKVADARATVVLNGVTVQNNVAITNRTSGGAAEGPTFGPVTLQDNGSAVQFRNIQITPLDIPPEFQSAGSTGGTGTDTVLFMSNDAPGNTYVSGSFNGTTVIGGTAMTSAGSFDAYLAKFGPAGNALWVRQVGSTGDESGFGSAPLANGDVYFCGRFHNTASFGSTNLTASGQDLFLARYDGNGNLIWARKAGGTGSDAAYAVVADAAGNAYITGDFAGTADFGGVQITSGSGQNSFVAKYDPTGALVWVAGIVGTGSSSSTRLHLDSALNLYVGGSFQGDIQFVTPSLTSAGGNDGFVLKLDVNGAAQWVQQFGGPGNDVVRGMDTSADGTLNVGGSFRSSMTIGSTTLSTAGSDDWFVTKLDSAGVPLWSRKAGGNGSDLVHSLTTDALGNVLVVGSFSANATFNATTLINSGSTDMAVVKYDASGAQKWARSSANGQAIGGLEIQADTAGRLQIAGEFSGSLPLDHLTVNSAGQTDIFIAALASTSPVINQQPLGGNVLAGQNVTFTVAATGTGGVTYQWRLNGTNIVGATNASYTIANAAANAAGTYDALVTHAFGSIASSPATVSVIPSANPLPFTFAQRYGGTGAESVQGLARDAAGNSYLAGFFSGTLDLGTTNLVSAGGNDVFLAKLNPAGVVLWATSGGGPGDDIANGIAVAPNGEVLVCGYFQNNSVFGTNAAVTNIFDYAGFTARFSPDGSMRWVQTVINPLPEAAIIRNVSVAVDANGEAFVAGKGAGLFDFGSTNQISPGGNTAGYLVKYDANGNVKWIQNTGRPVNADQNASSYAVACDSAGNAYWGGRYGVGSAGNTFPAATNVIVGGVTLTDGGGSQNGFVAKITGAGLPVWVRAVNGPGAERVASLAVDAAGNVFAMGPFDAAYNFGTGSVLTPSNGNNGTGFLLKLNANGTPAWVREVGSDAGGFFDRGALATDALGNVYLAHNFIGTSIVGNPPAVAAGGTDALVAKFDSAGKFLWAQTFGSTSDDIINGIVVDANQSIFIAGTLGQQAVLGPFTLNNAGASDLFLATLATQPPVITTQPASQSISVNQPVTFSVGFTGALPFSYQWRFNGMNLPGATNASLTIPAVVPASAGGYSVLVSDALGIATSDVATLTVDTSGTPFILTPPQGQTVQQGTAVLFNVGAVGASPLSYQWRKNGTNLVGQNFSFLALGSTTTNDSGNYAVVVTNVFGAVTSAPAVLLVAQIFPPVITNPPVDLTVLVGANATFSVGVSGTAPFNYQWVRGGVALPGNDAPTLTLTNVTLADAGTYFVQVFNSAGLATSQSQPATLTVLAPPVLLTQPQPATVLQGGNTNFAVSVTGSPTPAVAWFRDGVRLVNSAGYSGVNTTNLQVFNAQNPQAGGYYLIATNTAGAITSAPVALTVLLAPVITAHPTNVLLTRTNIASVLPATLSVAATGAPPVLFQWRFNGVDLPDATNAVLTLTNVTRLQNGLYQALVANVAGGTTSSAALVRVRVPQRVESPVFVPGQPFRLRFTDDTGEQATPADLAKIEVQAATNLVGPGILWVTLTNGFSVVNGVVQFDDPASTNMTRRYYRIIEK
ncbi:MAG: hypothetical protein B9S33_06445 [Pedosphaera sp. Tous-C6FEB]|nr:MAG: hypothetical protein B9S33_06445 [Pedosphaera sp. Tous-C6FEB]